MARSSQRPKAGLLFDLRNNDSGRGGRVAEDSRISLLPNFPRDRHHNVGNRLLDVASKVDHLEPPILDGDLVTPSRRRLAMNAKPSDDLVPNSGTKSTLEENVSRRLLNLLTKGAQAAIRPSPSLQPISRPHAILDDQPRKKLHFGRAQVFHIVVEVGLRTCHANAPCKLWPQNIHC